MTYRLFQYALPAPPLLEDLNTFLAASRVAAVATHLVPVAGGTMLVFIVETVGGVPGPGSGSGGPKTDYREQLNAADFMLFDRLRDERKQWADAEGVPVYTVFTNAQLAAMAQRRPRTAAELGTVEGVGPARVEKYGARLLALLTAPVAAGPPVPIPPSEVRP
jgi:superfamily II DNA helicase RecQ